MPALPYSLDGYADDAIQLLDHLEIQACCLVGISFGGLVTQRIAELRLDLVESLGSRLIKFDPEAYRRQFDHCHEVA